MVLKDDGCTKPLTSGRAGLSCDVAHLVVNCRRQVPNCCLNLGRVSDMSTNLFTPFDNIPQLVILFKHLFASQSKIVIATWTVAPMSNLCNFDIDTGTVGTVTNNPIIEVEVIELEGLNEEVDVGLGVCSS